MEVYEKIIKRILARHDLNQPGGIDRAYESCVEYARQHLLRDPNCNAFLHLAAQKLETIPIHLDRISITTPLPLGARLDLYVSDENEVVLSGNEEGLDYLKELLDRLKTENSNDHLHVDPGEGLLTQRSWPLVVYKEEAEWFDEQDKAGPPAPAPSDRGSLRPEDVVAVQFLDPPPPVLALPPYRLLPARHQDRTQPAGAPPYGWEKPFDPATPGRTALFLVAGENNVERKVLLHLDDPGVLFFKRTDLQKFV